MRVYNMTKNGLHLMPHQINPKFMIEDFMFQREPYMEAKRFESVVSVFLTGPHNFFEHLTDTIVRVLRLGAGE